MKPVEEPEIRVTAPSFIPGSETGLYIDDGYGEMEIVKADTGLVMRYYGTDYPLKHITGNHYISYHPLGMKMTFDFEPDMFARISAVVMQVHTGCAAEIVFRKRGG